jgi:hypothetical protein
MRKTKPPSVGSTREGPGNTKTGHFLAREPAPAERWGFLGLRSGCGWALSAHGSRRSPSGSAKTVWLGGVVAVAGPRRRFRAAPLPTVRALALAARNGQLLSKTGREGPRSAAEWSVPWKRSFCSSGQDRTGTVSCHGHRRPDFSRLRLLGSARSTLATRPAWTPVDVGFPERLPDPFRPRNTWKCLQAQRNASEVPGRAVVSGGDRFRGGWGFQRVLFGRGGDYR